MSEPVRVFLADDRGLLSLGFMDSRGVAAGGEPGPEPPGRSGPSRACEDLATEVILLDLDLPPHAGPSPVLDALALLHRLCPEVKVLVLTSVENDELMRRLARAGASGYLLKSESGAVVLQAIRAVKGGATWFSREAIGKIMRQPSVPDTFDLTERERDVLRALVRGWGNSRIAVELSLSEQTVRNYVSRIYNKLGVDTRAEAMVWAIHHGFDRMEP